MDVLTSETCWALNRALNKVIIKQVASSLSLFTPLAITTFNQFSIKQGKILCWTRYCLLLKKNPVPWCWILIQKRLRKVTKPRFRRFVVSSPQVRAGHFLEFCSNSDSMLHWNVKLNEVWMRLTSVESQQNRKVVLTIIRQTRAFSS